MFDIKSFDPLNTSNEELKGMYSFKVRRSKEQNIPFHQSFEEWKSSVLKIYDPSAKKKISLKLLLNNNRIVGSIGFNFLNLGTKQELQLMFPHVLNEIRACYWENFKLKDHLNNWVKNAPKSKFETGDKQLIQNLLKSGFHKGNNRVILDLLIEYLNWEVVNNTLASNILTENKLNIDIIQNPSDLELEQLAKLMTTLLNDMKRVYTSHQYLETAENLKNAIKAVHTKNQRFNWLVLKYRDKKMVGMSWVRYANNKPKFVWQYMSGVLSNYRNKGITKYMKAYNYKNLLNKFPTIQEIKTDCYDGNFPMIHINEQLGFKQTKTSTDLYYQRDME